MNEPCHTHRWLVGQTFEEISLLFPDSVVLGWMTELEGGEPTVYINVSMKISMYLYLCLYIFSYICGVPSGDTNGGAEQKKNYVCVHKHLNLYLSIDIYLSIYLDISISIYMYCVPCSEAPP